jgi:RNA polymerase sigma factor (sigma-70 family)
VTDEQSRQNSASRREAEFSAFYDKHFAAVSRFGRTLGRNYHDAEDAAAEAMRELFEQWDTVAEKNRLPTAFRITRNQYVSMVRRAITRHNHLSSADARPRETTLESGFELLATSEAVQNLPPRRRQIIRLDVEGLSHAEIAQVLGIETDSVAQELSRARSKLRRLMGRRPARRQKPDTAWEGGTSV